jgi:general secretion pathway protein K
MTPRRPPARTRRRQRGAALLTAMIIVTLIVTLAASMVWQQWRAVQVESAERARVQATWILAGARDFALLLLREDQRVNAGYTGLADPWATPLAESRLSTFLAADKSNVADDGPEAFLSGSIADAQGRYNLTNLINDTGEKKDELAALTRLCAVVGVDGAAAAIIATGMRQAAGPAGDPSASTPLLPKTIAQLRWFGLGPETIAKLEPHVVLLPVPTPLNLNTASREVLAGVIDGIDVATAERIVRGAPFKVMERFTASFPTLPVRGLAVHSDYFEITGKLRLENRVLVQHSLVNRYTQANRGRYFSILRSERTASLDEPAS